ncbi:MAG: hypothetical protein DRO07_01720 [Candidatus Iainarchaeum archaeon]|uniref:Uncharacterized protein n=1 Tax=Candidatus Iainarchaeum sp. TaxID=3101447 RepID=A0A497JG02_9ARCH|nr:MAG: hypothetical protein DRO07_01720 [Candidatus Diapherotrites archaeon]
MEETRATFLKQSVYNPASSRRYAERLLKEELPRVKTFLRELEQALIEAQVRLTEIEEGAKRTLRQ